MSKIGLVIHNSSSILAISKPAGLTLQASYRSPSRRDWDALVTNLKRDYNCADLTPVHRLDKTTTGVLLFSKSKNTAKTLSKQWEKGDVIKDYWAVVAGNLRSGLDNRGMAEHEVKMKDDDGLEKVKQAKTEWQVLDRTSTHSFLRLRLHTGRKHQLRQFCATYLQTPIVGDFKYTTTESSPSSSTSLKARSTIPPNLVIPSSLDRVWQEGSVLLHARKLSFYTWSKETRKRSRTEIVADEPELMMRFRKAVGLKIPLEELESIEPSEKT